jgi:hypothetical protein
VHTLTLSPPAVKTQWLSQCQAFQRLVRSSHTLVNWTPESIFNQFSVYLKTLNALCVCLQYKHSRSTKRVIRSDKPVTLLLLLWSHKCDFGAEPRSRIIATSAVKGLTDLFINPRSATSMRLLCGYARYKCSFIHSLCTSWNIYSKNTFNGWYIGCDCGHFNVLILLCMSIV